MTADEIRFPLLLLIFCNIKLFFQHEAVSFSQLLNKIPRKRAPENVLTRVLKANFGLCF